MKSYEQSRQLYERAAAVLAGAVSSEFRKFSYPHPLFYVGGEGSHITDADGNSYLDFSLSQGPLILGHNHPHVLASVEQASRSGQIYAGQHMGELQLAEKIQSLIPCAELLRFSLCGSEAVHTALRVARAVTGRPKFLRFEGHYHGWFDNVALGIDAPSLEAMGPRENPVAQPWTAGLPVDIAKQFIILPWNDLALLERTLAQRHSEIAAIITEPVMCNNGCIEPKEGFLAGLRALCTQYEIALIFDEVITGFRLGLGGAQGHYGVIPDLAVFAKALASGYPISVLAGKKYWMEPIATGRVIHAGTMNSGVAPVAAAYATIEVLERENPYPRMYALGQQLIEGLRSTAAAAGLPLVTMGPGPMFHVGFNPSGPAYEYRDMFGYDRGCSMDFVRGMQERGIRLIGRGLWYISAVHSQADIDTALAAAYEVLGEIGKNRHA